ncbi:MAG: erythromycin esterase family protein [Gemmatimonadaceae bacterium]
MSYFPSIRKIAVTGFAVLALSGLAQFFVAPTACAQGTSAPRLPTNLGFEEHDVKAAPVNWYAGGNGYEVIVDSIAPMTGKFSLRSKRLDPTPYDSNAGNFGVATSSYPISAVAGRKLRLTGYIRSENINKGYAGFWMRVDGPCGSVAFDNMKTRGARGTTPWTRYEIELPVDSGAKGVVLGMLHPGDGSAWFDSLTIEVVGAPMSRTVPAPKEIVPLADDATRLLSDAELSLPPDACTIPENPTYTNWVLANAHPVRSLHATDFSDLQFLKPILKGKRIIALGESSHGVAEFDMAKVRLIKYMHEELGYDVIAFESSTYECERAQFNAKTLSAVQLMRACIFGVWHTEEVLPLFTYIKETHNTAHPLILAGFDEQTSAPTANTRPDLFRSLIDPIDSAYANEVYWQDKSMLSTMQSPNSEKTMLGMRERLVAFYDTLANFLDKNRKRIEASRPEDPNIAIIARQAAISMKVLVRQISAGMSPEGTDFRDRGMADNLDFLLNELYPKKSMILWAHNFHLQYRQTIDPSVKTAPRTMGTWVVDRHRSELYTLGLFMYRGSAAQNNRVVYPIARMKSGSLESILHAAPWRYSLVDFSKAKREPGSEWMWSTLTAMSWGMNPENMTPRGEYDGVLFIDTTHPPKYVNFNVP